MEYRAFKRIFNNWMVSKGDLKGINIKEFTSFYNDIHIEEQIEKYISDMEQQTNGECR